MAEMTAYEMTYSSARLIFREDVPEAVRHAFGEAAAQACPGWSGERESAPKEILVLAALYSAAFEYGAQKEREAIRTLFDERVYGGAYRGVAEEEASTR